MAPSIANEASSGKTEIEFENSLEDPDRPQPPGFALRILVVTMLKSGQPVEAAWLTLN